MERNSQSSEVRSLDVEALVRRVQLLTREAEANQSSLREPQEELRNTLEALYGYYRETIQATARKFAKKYQISEEELFSEGFLILREAALAFSNVRSGLFETFFFKRLYTTYARLCKDNVRRGGTYHAHRNAEYFFREKFSRCIESLHDLPENALTEGEWEVLIRVVFPDRRFTSKDTKVEIDPRTIMALVKKLEKLLDL